MNKLIHELNRLYLLPGTLDDTLLEARQRGEHTQPVALAAPDGRTRAIVIAFRKGDGDEPGGHWNRLCDTANALQAELALPAPGVSVSAVDGFCLWLALDAPIPWAEAQAFVHLLGAGRLVGGANGERAGTVELPPCRDPASGRWAAFINPGMGASFVDEPGLEMAPPPAAQAAFLEGLNSIAPAQFAHAVERLRAGPPAAPQADAAIQAARAPRPADAGLLLKDATLEDIVRHLHARGIEPTFRHVLPRG